MILLRMIAFRPAAVFQPQPAAGDSPPKKPEPPVAPVALDVTPAATQHPDTQHTVQTAAPASLTNGQAAAEALATSADSPEAAESDDGAIQAPVREEASAGALAEEAVSGEEGNAAADLFREPPVSAPRAAPSTNGTANGAAAASQTGISAEPVQMAREEETDETTSRQVSLSELTTDTWPELFEAFQFSGILHNIALNLELNKVRGALELSSGRARRNLLNERHPAHWRRRSRGTWAATSVPRSQWPTMVVTRLPITARHSQPPASPQPSRQSPAMLRCTP